MKTMLGVLGVVAHAAAAREGRMQDRQVAALTGMMDAVNAGDAGRYARLHAQDAVIAIHGSGRLEGRGAIEQHEVELLRQFPGARLAFYDAWLEGPRAVVHYAVNGKTPGGQAMGHEGLLFYRFEPSGLIREERRYLDSLTPMAQLGLLGALPARPLPTLPARMKAHVAEGSPAEAENAARARAAFAALDSGNETAFLSSLAEDAVLDDLMLPRPFVGKQEVKAWLEEWTAAIGGASTEIASVLGAGEFVLVETVLRGTLKGPLGPVSAADRGFAVHRAAMVRVRDGRLSRLSFFTNGKELAEAVGQWPLPAAKPPSP
jgi:uncharacterized protein (TIGR02246 family)